MLSTHIKKSLLGNVCPSSSFCLIIGIPSACGGKLWEWLPMPVLPTLLETEYLGDDASKNILTGQIQPQRMREWGGKSSTAFQHPRPRYPRNVASLFRACNEIFKHWILMKLSPIFFNFFMKKKIEYVLKKILYL